MLKILPISLVYKSHICHLLVSKLHLLVLSLTPISLEVNILKCFNNDENDKIMPLCDQFLAKSDN